MTYEHTIKKVLNYYHLGKLISFRAMEGGFVNKNYKIKTEKGIYFFREFLGLQKVHHIDDVNNFLFTAKFPTAKPILASNNKTYVLLGERIFVIFEFKGVQKIDDHKYMKSQNEEEQKLWMSYEERELNSARVLAKLHNEVSKVPKRRRVYMSAHNDKEILKLKELIKKKINSNSSYSEVLKKYEREINYYINLFYQLKKQIPRKEANCVIHGDFWHGQLLFDGAEVAALIDFDAVVHGNALYDIMKGGVTSFSRTFNKKDVFSLDKFKLFLKAYAEVAEKPLNIEPKEPLFFILHGELNVLNYFISQEKESSDFLKDIIEFILQSFRWCEQHEKEIEEIFKKTDNWIKKHSKIKL